jgi:hypothetical protein
MASGSISHFLDNFLQRPASGLPKGAQWAIEFADITNLSLLNAIDKAYEYEPAGTGGALGWNTSTAASTLLTPDYQSTHGCLFAQAIQLPGDGIQTNPGGNIQYNNFIRGRVGGGRNDFNPLKMTFLDTNISFVDTFLRGWALATANFGLIARPQGDPLQYRTTLFCYKFGVYDLATPPYITQQYTFKDICCISVTDEEYNYTPITSPILREAEFIFNSYSIDSTTHMNQEVIGNQQASVAAQTKDSANYADTTN